ncbi:SDR family NAD(P)-dependent oxidoreductase [Pseudonocardia sp. T1-2H]|uniref:SDR family NAD(P)-dependent oxidoreductase n=1 Tax=Pseudonocardia sp. T1-2H TaxID=3128899 RepID=UPI003100ABD9
MSARFAGRRVAVTGAARGIGAEIARRFAAEGAKVAVLDRLAVEDPASRGLRPGESRSETPRVGAGGRASRDRGRWTRRRTPPGPYPGRARDDRDFGSGSDDRSRS